MAPDPIRPAPPRPATMDSSPASLDLLPGMAWSPAAVATALLVALLIVGVTMLARARDQRRRNELRTRIAALASQVTTLATQVARETPAVRAILLQLRARMAAGGSSKLLDEE